MSTGEITKDIVKWGIVSKDEQNMTIIVAYWAEGYTAIVHQNLQLAIDPETNAIPSGDELVNYVMLHAPVEQLNRDITRFKKATLVDWTLIDQLIAVGAETIPKFDI